LSNINDFALLDHPGSAVLIGAFAALILLGLVRRFKKIFAFGVLGLTITIGMLVWQLSG